jgi:hypothetical protein
VLCWPPGGEDTEWVEARLSLDAVGVGWRVALKKIKQDYQRSLSLSGLGRINNTSFSL